MPASSTKRISESSAPSTHGKAPSRKKAYTARVKNLELRNVPVVRATRRGAKVIFLERKSSLQ